MADMQFERCAVKGGAILYDPRWGGNAPEFLFDREYWRRGGRLRELPGGRGGIALLDHEQGTLVLRHYRRGGWPARFSEDRYLRTGERHVRAFVELRLTAALRGLDLPVPVPVAARYRRDGISYEADLVTVLIPDATPLAARLAAARLAPATWAAVGACVARFHRAGLDHADLNAHNVLLDAREVVHLVDFDGGRLRRPGAWSRRDLRRLRRSLCSITRGLEGRFDGRDWAQLLAGYSGGSGPSGALR